MCAVSMVSDYYGQYPNPRPVPMPWPIIVPTSLPWSQESFKLLQEVMEKMKQLDEKLGLANCEDPNKAKWMKGIGKRLRKIEKVKK